MARTIAYADDTNSVMSGVKSIFDIWLMGVDGTNQRRLTTTDPVLNNAAKANGADFRRGRPDGRRLGYTEADTTASAACDHGRRWRQPGDAGRRRGRAFAQRGRPGV